MRTREIAHSCGSQQFQPIHDDELEATLNFAGNVSVPNDRRNSFQTTYVNEQLVDYAFMVPDQEPVHLMACPPNSAMDELGIRRCGSIFHMVLGIQRAAVRAETEVPGRVVGA
jgi:hypothetical protein